MSDARWFEIDAAVLAAVRHFTGAGRIFTQIAATMPDEDRYVVEMAFLHAMLAGQTSLEAALLGILDLCGEEPPSGARWHADLVRRAAHAIGERPPILGDEAARAADETRRFRSIAAHAYDAFDHKRATAAVDSALLLAAVLPAEVAGFRRLADP